MRDRRLPLRLALVLGVLALLVFAAPGCGARAATPTTTTTTAPTARTTTSPAATTTGCSTFGHTFMRSYNRKAATDGNPVRIVSACCASTARPGVNACHIMVTLAGSADRGCERVDISNAGGVVGEGKHERCPGRQDVTWRRLAALALAASLGACAAVTAAGIPRAPHATTPTSAGPIDAAAVPLGDGYVSTTPRVGYVDSCVTHFGAIRGADVDGPWIDTRTKTWDEQTKLAVNGAVRWAGASYTVTVSSSTRRISFDDLPIDHTTGVFPIASTDPAHAYDQNPNRIEAQRVSWSLALDPLAAGRPSCAPGGPIGVLDDGVYLYSALDGEGRDAAAHELLDACGGHPDPSGSYHHHDIPACILDKAPDGAATLVGYALDGYGIYVVKSADGTLPTNTALDACHGATSVVPWNGRPTRIYHYVATLEYPYTIGCFHGTPTAGGHGQVGGAGASGPGAGPPAAP